MTRPLPSGQVTPSAAFVFMVLLCLIGLAVLLQLNRFSILLGLGVLPIVALYPFVKRISHWPQAVLGLAFNWGALMGWAAVLGRLDLAPLVLYAGAVCWTIGYDTIYAHQDREDDGLLGVKSTALRFGSATKPWLTLLYSHRLARHHRCRAHGGRRICFPARHGRRRRSQLGWQVVTLDMDDAENCLDALPLEPRLWAIVFARNPHRHGACGDAVRVADRQRAPELERSEARLTPCCYLPPKRMTPCC